MSAGVAAHLLADYEILPARGQMGASLGFHIIFACFGIAMPTIVLIAHWIGLKRGDAVALLLAHRWSKVMVVIFSVGAVSGAVLSYEMGLLWPRMMGRFGAAIGVPFSVEAIWFFVEAIFTAIYVYGWRHLPPWLHWWTGIPLVVSGVLGAMSVVAANSWMNQPAGFTLKNGHIVSVDPWAVFFNKAMPWEVPHMIFAAYMVTAFVMAGVYAVGLLRGRHDRYHRLAFLIPFVVGGIFAPVQAVFGDMVARQIETQQPIKYAAMEYVAHTQRHVTEWIGGFLYNHHIYFGLGIPYLNSLFVGYSPNARVIGWDTVPANQRPPLISLIHLCFDLMVMIGVGLIVFTAWQAWWGYFHRRVLLTKWFLVPMSVAGLGAILAMESGWIVTEVGRQPWIVYGVMRTSDAVTTSSGVPVTLALTIAIYLILTAVIIVVPWIMSRRWRKAEPPADAAGHERLRPVPATSEDPVG